MNIDMFKTNGSSPPVAQKTSTTEVLRLWQGYFPDIEMKKPRYFERYEHDLIRQALEITRVEREAGRFKTEDEENIGRYAVAVCKKLLKDETREQLVSDVIVVEAQFCFWSTIRGHRIDPETGC